MILLLSVAYLVCWVRAAQSRGCVFLQDLAQHRSPRGGLQALLKSVLVIVKANESGRAEGFFLLPFFVRKISYR